MSTTIESLELEIVSNSKSASDGIDALTQSLTILKNASNSCSKDMRKIVDSFAPLSELSKIKLPFVASLKNIPKALEGLEQVDMADFRTTMEEVANSFKPLEAVGRTSIPAAVNAMKKLPDVLKNIDTRALYTKIQSLTRIFKPLADEMEKIANGFSAMPAKIQKLIKETDKIPSSNKKATISFTDLFHALKSGVNSIRGVVSGLKSFIEQSNDYIENAHLFSVAMGEYASEAMEYAESVRNVMGIDPNDWIRSQGVFMTLATGFGVASDRANTMSKNLTQLGYDLASFYNMDVEDAMQKLQSGLAGELEPLRRIGYDLSQAKLEATAAELGIDKAVSSMTQAEKAQLRYYAIMTQVTETHGDMADTLTSPANMLRVLKSEFSMATREIGNAFIPALNAILPYAIAATRVIGTLAKAIASIAGYEAPEIGDSASKMVENTDAMTENLEESQDAAKKLKSYMLGFDELNVINPNSGSEDTSGSAFEFDLPTYNFLGEETENVVASIVEDMKEWLGITGEINTWADLFDTKLGKILTSVIAIGIAFVAWKVVMGIVGVVTSISSGIGKIASLFGKKGKETEAKVPDVDSPAEIEEVSSKLSETTTKLKGLIKNLALGIVVIAEVIVAVALIVGAIWALGWGLEQVGISWQPVIDNGANIAIAMGLGIVLLAGIGAATALLGSVGTTLIVNLALGIAMLALVGVSAALFLAEIILVGTLLNEVGKAWQPVIDNGETITTGIAVGTALLIGIGVATALLGAATVGTVGALPLAIAAGTLMLGELAVAFVVFTDSLILVANQLSEDLHPALSKTAEILPDLTENMSAFTSAMGAFAWEVVLYSINSSIAGIATTIDTIIGFFTQDPVTKMSDEVDSQYDEFNTLITGLELIIPRIEYATDLVTKYNDAMGGFDKASGANNGLLGSLGIVKGAINNIIAGIESLANGVIDAINGMINALNSLSFDVPDWVPLIGGQKFGLNIPNLVRISIPRFAEGGFPEQGQMFIAREAGAEMVGNIGRRTAVVNNDQIVASISGGVAEANEEQNMLLREQNSLLRAILEKESGVYLDGKHLTDSVEKYQRERGRNLIVGGVL